MANVRRITLPWLGVLKNAEKAKAPSSLAHLWYVWRKKPFGIVGAVLVMFMTGIAVAAPLIAPHSPNEFVGDPLQAPSSAFWFGTDSLGRDVLSRTIYGAQISVATGVAATVIALTAGTIFGLLAYFGGWVDGVIQRVLEALNSFPTIVLALVFIAVFGRASATSSNIAVVAWELIALEMAIGLTFVFAMTRIVRSAVLRERGIAYIEAAQSVGVPSSRILWRHILPNVMPYLIVSFSTLIGTVILIEAALSFLGYGVAPGVPSWGGDLSTRNRDYFISAPWLLLAPGLALSLLIIGYNFLGDALRDVLDPRLRSR